MFVNSYFCSSYHTSSYWSPGSKLGDQSLVVSVWLQGVPTPVLMQLTFPTLVVAATVSLGSGGMTSGMTSG